MRVSIATALAAAASLGAVARADDVSVKVMAFNIRTSHAGGDAGARCSNWGGERKGNVVTQITSVSPDFVGTQETSNEQKGFLDDALKDTYRSIGTPAGSLNGAASETNAVWYKHNEWEKIVDGTFWFGPNPDAPSAAWGMAYYRTFTYGRFKHIKSGQTVCVLNTHYETPGNDLAQNEASKIIIAKTPAVCSGDDKIKVLTGDFNALKNYPAMQTLFADGWQETSDEPTFCGDMINPSCQQKFDFTLHKLSSGVCVTEDEVLRTSFNGCFPSDHAALVATFCLSGSCCGTPETTTPSPTPEPTANASSSAPSSLAGSRAGSGSGGNEADIHPGVVVPGGSGELLLASGGGAGAPEGGVTTPGASSTTTEERDGDDATTAGSGTAQEITTKSAQSTDATGTVFAILGVIAAVGAVCVFVIKKKRALDAQLDDQKSGRAPMPNFFSRAEEEALSPRRSTSTRSAEKKRATSRKFSSPVPTLETISEEDRKRSFSQTSSIPCSRRSSIPLSPSDYSESLDRMSSPVMMDDDGRTTGRGSSRLYFSEVVSQRNGRRTDDFALL